MVIRQIRLGSAVKLFGAFYAMIGLLIGACFSLLAIAGLSLPSSSGDAAPGWLGAAFGLLAIVVAPIFYGVIGVISGVVTAALYNLTAGIVGGLEVDVQ